LRGVRLSLRAAALALLPGLAATPLAASAAHVPLPKPSSALLWATVDVCNTALHPDTIGIRGSMPGTGDRQEQMYMRFIVEYRSVSGHWHYFRTGGVSGFVAVGDAGSLSRQAGQNFVLSPNFSATYVLRGVVEFEWRLHGRTIASSVRSTTGGHRVAAGADPPGFSAPSCKLERKRA
jgi:hypothetical protein